MFLSEHMGSKDYLIVNHAFYLNGWNRLSGRSLMHETAIIFYFTWSLRRQVVSEYMFLLFFCSSFHTCNSVSLIAGSMP